MIPAWTAIAAYITADGVTLRTQDPVPVVFGLDDAGTIEHAGPAVPWVSTDQNFLGLVLAIDLLERRDETFAALATVEPVELPRVIALGRTRVSELPEPDLELEETELLDTWRGPERVN